MLTKILHSKKTFNYILLALAICIVGYFIYTGIIHRNTSVSQESKASSVVSLVNKDKVLHEDLNGDGRKESITLKSINGSLTASVLFGKDKLYSLSPNEEFPTLGEYCSYWPTRVSALDLTRDNGKDIIIQSCFHNKAIQHIFLWNGNGYTTALASNSNLVGIMDSHNNKSPKIFSGSFSNGTLAMSSYTCNKGVLRHYESNISEAIPGLDTTSNFICLVESFPNLYLSVPDYIYPQISGNDIETLFRLANNNNYYIFQDGYFIDSAWDKYGKATCENWVLNFRCTPTEDTNKASNITIDITLNRYEDDTFPYKITSINVY